MNIDTILQSESPTSLHFSKLHSPNVSYAKSNHTPIKIVDSK